MNEQVFQKEKEGINHSYYVAFVSEYAASVARDRSHSKCFLMNQHDLQLLALFVAN